MIAHLTKDKMRRWEGGAGGGRSASPRKASHALDALICNGGGPYHPPFWRCHKLRGGPLGMIWQHYTAVVSEWLAMVSSCFKKSLQRL